MIDMIKKNCLSCKYGYNFYKNTCKCSKESADSNTKCTDLPRKDCPNYKEELWQVYWKRVWKLRGEVVTDNYTTQSQSRELLEHGLDPSTADMIWTYDFVAGGVICVNIISDLLKPESPDIPAWSLSQLLNLLPDTIVVNNITYHLVLSKTMIRYVGKNKNGYSVDIVVIKNKKAGLLNCLIEAVIWLMERNLLWKEPD